MTTYRKDYSDPHEKLKAELALLLATALASKRKLILEYVAEFGTDGLLDYADSILDAGWDAHFEAAAVILAAAAVDSSLDTLDASGNDFSDEFVANIEKHHDMIAKTQAAALLGLAYDHTRDVAIPTLVGWSIGAALLDQLGGLLHRADAEEWSSAKLDTALSDLSAFSAHKAEAMAQNALAFVDGAAARQTASASGATMKRSLTASDDKVCPDCVQNWQDGWIGVNEAFSGSDTEDVPHHPNCRCSVEYQWLEMPLQIAAYSPDEARNKQGEWTSGGGGGDASGKQKETDRTGREREKISETDIGRMGNYQKALRDGPSPEFLDNAGDEKVFNEINRQRDVLLKTTGDAVIDSPEKSRWHDAQGVEHKVWFSPDGKTATKETQNGYGYIEKMNGRGGRDATPQEYLKNLQLQNDIFGTKTVVKGITKSGSIVTEQPAIDAKGHVNLDQITQYMAGKGFKPVESDRPGIYYHAEKDIIATDATPGNLLLDSGGQVHAIDVRLRQGSTESRHTRAIHSSEAVPA